MICFCDYSLAYVSFSDKWGFIFYAISPLQPALRLFPGGATRLIVQANMGIIQLRRQNPESAQDLLESVVEEAKNGGLGTKYQAA